MKASALHLLKYYVDSMKWRTLEEFYTEGSPDEIPATYAVEDLEWDLQRADIEAPRTAAYRLKVSLAPNPTKYQYSWAVVLVGVFQLQDAVPDAQAEAVLDTNAPALLFGAAREVLASAIGRGPLPAPMLPTVHFAGLERADREAEKPALQAAVKKAAKAKPTKSKQAAAPADEPATGASKPGKQAASRKR